MRGVHVGLLALIAAVFLVGWFEIKPALEDFDPARHAQFADTWDSRVHISYWEKWGSFEADACQAMVDAFNRSQTDIYVHYIRTSQVDRKAMLAAIGEAPPDVAGLWNIDVVPFAEGNAVQPLDDLMAESGLADDYYIPNYLNLCRYKGRTWALPTGPASLALFWNKAHFRAKAEQLRAAGCDPDRAPTTIEEMDRYADVLNEFEPDGSPRIMGFLPTEPGWYNHAWGYYFGGQVADPATGRITTDDPGNIRALLWAKRYAEKYGREKLLQFRAGFGNFDSPFNAFIEGKVSMEQQGVWFPLFIRRHRPQLEFGVAPFPTAEGVPGPRSLLEADVVVLPRGCKHPKEAWRFIVWMQKEGLVIMNRLQGKHLAFREVPPGFHEGHPNLEIEVFEKVAIAPESFIIPLLPLMREYRDELTRAFDHVWNWVPAPASAYENLTGEARERKITELCEAEIRRTLAAIREKMQRKAEVQRARDQRRGETP
jgi:ABC-type glycerol-3-phosphate transport system substrate-binding protein